MRGPFWIRVSEKWLGYWVSAVKSFEREWMISGQYDIKTKKQGVFVVQTWKEDWRQQFRYDGLGAFEVTEVLSLQPRHFLRVEALTNGVRYPSGGMRKRIIHKNHSEIVTRDITRHKRRVWLDLDGFALDPAKWNDTFDGFNPDWLDPDSGCEVLPKRPGNWDPDFPFPWKLPPLGPPEWKEKKKK